MKKITYPIVVFLVLWHGKVFSQHEIPELFKAATAAQYTASSMINNVMANPITKEVRFVRFSNLSEVSETQSINTDSYFRFTIPRGTRTKEMRNVLSIPTHIEAEESGNYTYHSDLTYGRHGKGSMVLIHENGHSYGSMQLGNRYFRIESLSKDMQVLIELDSEILNSKDACDTVHGTSKNNSIVQPYAQGNASCYSRNVRVLVMFTDKANRISNPQQLANTVIANTNRSLYNSRIYSSTLRFQLAGVRRINWNESSNPLTDLNSLVTFNELNTARQNLGADLVVVLTNGNYRGTLGIARLNQYGQANSGHVAIVQAATVGGLTFAHELGHLMGCRHDNDNRTGRSLPNNLSETAKGHVWYYRNWFWGRKHYQKSVVASGPSKGSRVMHYSNPSVKAHRKARDRTGNSRRNNYQQLRNAARVVSCYNSFEEMTASISGPSFAEIGESINLNASVSNCANRTYRWEVSSNGFSYSFLGNGSSVSYTIHPPGSTNFVRFRLTVNCSDGQRRTAFRSVYIENDCGGKFDRLRMEPCFLIQKTYDDVEKSNVEPQHNTTVLVYPNPTSDQVKLVFDESKDGIVEVMAYNMLSGKKHKLFRGHPRAKKEELLLNVSSLDQGLYQLIVKERGKEIYSVRMLIQR